MGDPAHWDDRYRTVGTEEVSWYEERPTTSLELLAVLGVGPEDSVVDVGGGASTLVDHLLEAGHTDVTVIDLSAVALEAARERLGDPAAVTWIVEDLLAWQPERRWDAWHDRAVLHFLVDEASQAAYRDLLRRAVEPGAAVVIGTFAEDGPTHCSGLPVQRYGPEALAELLGLDVVEQRRVVHRTPGQVEQPFTWVAGRTR